MTYLPKVDKDVIGSIVKDVDIPFNTSEEAKAIEDNRNDEFVNELLDSNPELLMHIMSVISAVTTRPDVTQREKNLVQLVGMWIFKDVFNALNRQIAKDELGL